MDKPQPTMNIYAISLIIFALATITLAFRYDISKKKRDNARRTAIDNDIATKKSLYQQALLSEDRQLALRLGREYYSTMRGGKLSVYDEQALTNDLSTMKQ